MVEFVDTGSTPAPFRLCAACAMKRCTEAGPECRDRDVCNCPCVLFEGEDLDRFLRDLRSVGGPWLVEGGRSVVDGSLVDEKDASRELPGGSPA
ncbi:hypothetical protein OOJ91_33680 [Micromonospora lupini]|uniref:hypothetical protein n=1 Tax=Micromonospora lupini TaxID=285679 RepID=UPI00225B2B08|nr:hypothetical protein [Micromonospora lupini]MCX5070798.1 hypothetical protein [Micromonospora lupini]